MSTVAITTQAGSLDPTAVTGQFGVYGATTITWSGQTFPAGTYRCLIETPDHVTTLAIASANTRAGSGLTITSTVSLATTEAVEAIHGIKGAALWGWATLYNETTATWYCKAKVKIYDFPEPTGISTTAANADVVRHLTLTAAQAIDAGRVIRADSAGKGDYAVAGTAAHAGTVVGISTAAAVSGATLTVRRIGPMTNAGWTFATLGAPVFLTGTGQVSQTPPTAGFVQRVGVALSATSMAVDLGEPVVLA